MIIYNSNIASRPYAVKSSWNGSVNQCWDAPNNKIYFNPLWFYLNSKLVLSCDIEVKDIIFVDGKTSNLSWNGGGIASDSGGSYWNTYPYGTPFRGYSALLFDDIIKNGKYHFSKELIISDSAVKYINDNSIMYQTLSWRIDYVTSGTITVRNILLTTKDSLQSSFDKNANFRSFNFAEDDFSPSILKSDTYCNHLYEL